MTNREETLKELFPEDILNISKDLTDGAFKFLKQVNHLLEE